MHRFLVMTFVLAAPVASADKLTYHAPQPVYELERTDQSLVLRSPDREFKILISKCNQSDLQDFWQVAMKEFDRYPQTRGALNSRYVDLDGKRRLMDPALGPLNPSTN
jgi:hypothetical protein